ncbi:glycoside hydrolase family 3 C-terminal domain-containing protein [Streptomyces spinosirectus]
MAHPAPVAPEADVSTTSHRRPARQIVTDGSVLLTNRDAILPLSPKVRKIAVIGPTASNTATNGVSASTVCGMSGFGAGSCTNPVASFDAITERAAADADVTVVFGYSKMGAGSDRANLQLDGTGDALIGAVAAAAPTRSPSWRPAAPRSCPGATATPPASRR